MLQAHSFLWNYLWVAPNAFLLALAFFFWKRGLLRQLPAFLLFAIVSAVGGLAVFAADISSWVSPANYWRLSQIVLVAESILKFILIGELFSRVLSRYHSISRLGRILVSGFGAAFVLLATLAAAYAHADSSVRLIAGYHLLQQTVFIVELGLVVVIFLFAAYFRLCWDHLSFGLLLGFGISSSVFLAGWAISVNADPSAHGRTLLDFIDMAAYHLCVLIWGYYLLFPGKVSTKVTSPALPDHNLDLWNRELERLLQP